MASQYGNDPTWPTLYLHGDRPTMEQDRQVISPKMCQLLGPFRADHENCPAAPRRLAGRLVRPTNAETRAVRRHGHRLYKNATAEPAKAPQNSHCTPVQQATTTAGDITQPSPSASGQAPVTLISSQQDEATDAGMDVDMNTTGNCDVSKRPAGQSLAEGGPTKKLAQRI